MNHQEPKYRNIISTFIRVTFVLLVGWKLCSSRHHHHHDKIVVACVGDSITAGSGASDKEATSYPPRLERYLSRNQSVKYVTKNFGVGGRTILKAGDMSYWQTEEYKTALETHHLQILVLAFGTNDAKSQNWNVTAFISDYVDMIHSFRNRTENLKIFICIPPPLYLAAAYNIQQHVVNNELPRLIPMIGQMTNSEVIDIFHAMGGKKLTKRHLFINDSLPIKWPNDGCHPNDLGYKVIARTVAKAILGQQFISSDSIDEVESTADDADNERNHSSRFV